MRKEILSGLLRKRVTIELLSLSEDTGGGYTSNWGIFAQVWAKIEPLRSRENFEARGVQTTTTYRMTIRFMAGITTQMRIRYGQKIFNIRSILNPEERGEMLEIIAEEGVAQ